MNSERVAGDVLLRSILASTTDDGVASNALLREFHRGYPVVNLRRLLVSGRDIPVGAGAFISAELGESAKEVLDDVAALASHPSPRVRGDVIGAITRAQRVATPSAIALAVQGIIDEHEGVRWKALRFLSTSERSILSGCLTHLAHAKLLVALRWLLDRDLDGAVDEICEWLGKSSRLERLIALAAALRVRDRTTAPLLSAAASTDDEVRVTAAEVLDDSMRPNP